MNLVGLRLDVDTSVMDTLSFPIVQLPTTLTYTRLMSEDEAHAVWSGSIVADADPLKFHVHGESDAGDRTMVFRVLEDLGSGYGRDRSGIYAGREKLKDCDPNSFQIFPDEYFGRDHAHVYHGAELIPDADPASFEILSQNYQRDNRRAYYLGKPLPGAVGSAFEIVGDVGGYGRDKNLVFGFGEPLPNRDASSFAVLARAFTKDKNGVYVYNKPLAGADVTSFRALGESGHSEYAVDTFRAYFRDRVIQNADATKLRVFGKNIEGASVLEVYATDDTLVFFLGDVIPGADAASFQVIAVRSGQGWYGPDFRAKDKNRTYRDGTVESTP